MAESFKTLEATWRRWRSPWRSWRGWTEWGSCRSAKMQQSYCEREQSTLMLQDSTQKVHNIQLRSNEGLPQGSEDEAGCSQGNGVRVAYLPIIRGNLKSYCFKTTKQQTKTATTDPPCVDTIQLQWGREQLQRSRRWVGLQHRANCCNEEMWHSRFCTLQNTCWKNK